MVQWRRKQGDERENRDEPEEREPERDPFWDDWWGGRDPFFSDVFRDMEQQFRRMRSDMNHMFEHARRGGLKSPTEGGPLVYGWSMRIGPDGIPHVQEFGNVKGYAPALAAASGKPGGETQLPAREPLTDVIEEGKTVSVTAEVPGVEKKDIELEVDEERLRIRVERPDRKYFKEVELPVPVKPDTTKATYQNGVLDVVLEKKGEKRKGKRVEVE